VRVPVRLQSSGFRAVPSESGCAALVARHALPRAVRGARHVSVARWVEAQAGQRVEDAADVLAHHYETAGGLLEAAGQKERVAELQPNALRYLKFHSRAGPLPQCTRTRGESRCSSRP
jgi:hypothetical protein